MNSILKNHVLAGTLGKLCAVLWMGGILPVYAEQGVPESRPPSDLIFVEAETLTGDPAIWKPVAYEHGFSTTGHYGVHPYPSGAKWLEGQPSTTGGSASTTVTIRKAGTYRVWIRNQDLPSSPFKVAVIQNEKTVGEDEYNDKTQRAVEEENAKLDPVYKPFLFTWWHVDAKLDAGPCVLRLSRAKDAVGQCNIDCFAFTTDQNYTPRVIDFVAPLYLRVVVRKLEDNKAGALLHFTGRLTNPPFLYQGDCITRKGLLKSVPTDAYLHEGDTSPWVNIGPYLDQREFNRLHFDMKDSRLLEIKEAGFTIELSHAPDKKPFKTFHREGKGSGILILLDPMKPQDTYSNIEGSARNLRLAREIPAPRWGKRPVDFALLTGCQEYDVYDPDVAIRTDLRVLRELGMTGSDTTYQGKWPSSIGMKYSEIWAPCYGYVKERGCLSQPDTDAIRKAVTETLHAFYNTNQQTLFIRLMDEIYGVDVDHMKKCSVCTGKFRDYLKQQGLKPSDLVPGATAQPGQDPWDAVHFTTDKSQHKLFYYSVRFRTLIHADFLKTVTDIVHEIQPGLRTAANASVEPTWWRNLLARGCDPFLLYLSGALTYGHGEDANSAAPSQQTSTFVVDLLRSACKYHDLPYGIYNMGLAPKWDIEAKAFAEVGHGVSFIHFYDYGPYHSSSPDPLSQRPDFMPALKEAAYIIGAADKALVGAKPVPTKVALIYSRSTDIWTDIDDVPYISNSGTERVDLYLLLRHLGYPIDILTEDDILEGRAKGYAAIFVAESHLADGVLPKLLAWVNDGGFLYLSAGAARFNQFNEPLRDLDDAGLKRDAFVMKAPAGYWPDRLEVVEKVAFNGKEIEAAGGYQKPSTNGTGKTVLAFVDGTPCAIDLVRGSGHILYVGFFPGTSYVRLATFPLQKEQQALVAAHKGYDTLSSTHFPTAYQELMRNLLKPIAYVPPVRVSNPLVEGCLLAGDNSYVLMLANWTGKPQQIEVSVDLPYKPGKPSAAATALKDIRRKDNTISFAMEVGPGDSVVLPKAN